MYKENKSKLVEKKDSSKLDKTKDDKITKKEKKTNNLHSFEVQGIYLINPRNNIRRRRTL